MRINSRIARGAQPSGHVLARMDVDTDAFEWVDLGDVAARVIGATGLCRVGEHYFTALQIRMPGTVGTLLAELDEAARIRRVARLEPVLDAHSLLAWHDQLLILSSGTNQVFAIDRPRDGYVRGAFFHPSFISTFPDPASISCSNYLTR